MVNSSWSSDAIWRYRFMSTLVQVMACCLMAPSHYLNQCWLIIYGILWSSVVWQQFFRKRSRYQFKFKNCCHISQGTKSQYSSDEVRFKLCRPTFWKQCLFHVNPFHVTHLMYGYLRYSLRRYHITQYLMFPCCVYKQSWSPFYQHALYKVWDEITYPFPNSNGCTVEVWEWMNNFIPHFRVDIIHEPW